MRGGGIFNRSSFNTSLDKCKHLFYITEVLRLYCVYTLYLYIYTLKKKRKRSPFQYPLAHLSLSVRLSVPLSFYVSTYYVYTVHGCVYNKHIYLFGSSEYWIIYQYVEYEPQHWIEFKSFFMFFVGLFCWIYMCDFASKYIYSFLLNGDDLRNEHKLQANAIKRHLCTYII